MQTSHTQTRLTQTEACLLAVLRPASESELLEDSSSELDSSEASSSASELLPWAQNEPCNCLRPAYAQVSISYCPIKGTTSDQCEPQILPISRDAPCWCSVSGVSVQQCLALSSDALPVCVQGCVSEARRPAGRLALLLAQSLEVPAMAKSKNHTAHNQTYKAHKNGIKKPKTGRETSKKGVSLQACLDFISQVCQIADSGDCLQMDPKFIRNQV